jgi:hypothetical protein
MIAPPPKPLGCAVTKSGSVFSLCAETRKSGLTSSSDDRTLSAENRRGDLRGTAYESITGAIKPDGMHATLTMLSAVTTVAALHLPALKTTLPTVPMAQWAASLRCAPIICAQLDDDDDDEPPSNDELMREAQRRHFGLNDEPNHEASECVVSETGRTCFGDDFVPPPIDEERRDRSPGISNNFYDSSTRDFITPWSGAGATSPEPDAAPSSAPQSRAQPPIDEERRRRSPGISNNFWDLSTDDFKKRWSGAAATPPPTSASTPRPAAAAGGGSLIGSLPSAIVLIFNPEQPNEGVYARDGAVVAFESQEDADLFAHLIVKEGFDLATPLSWSASKLAQFCDQSSLTVSLVPKGMLPRQAEPLNGDGRRGESGDPVHIHPLAMQLDSLLESTPDNCDGDDCTLWDPEEEKE